MIVFETNIFHINNKDEVIYLTIPDFEDTGLVNHCFSTRHGGVSKDIYKSMNLGFNRGDPDENVKTNFKRLCNTIDINSMDLVFSDQIHEAVVKVVTEKDKGKGISRESDLVGVDAIITNQPKVPLVTFYADCVPIYFLDPVTKVIGLSHAGWRGTVKKIAAKTVEKMVETFGCNPSNMLAAIAPSIGPCCFEVDTPVIVEFQKSFTNGEQELIINPISDEKALIDLWQANKIILENAGIPSKNITTTDICTMCNKEDFFSHRGSHGKRGSLAAIIELI